MLDAVMFDLSRYLTQGNLVKIASTVVIIVVALIVERVVKNAISRYVSRSGISAHIENVLDLVVRLVVALVAIVSVLQVYGLGLDWLIGLSAVAGAAIGFASTQTLGNFLAGFYILASQPFAIQDYVRIGDVEGEVLNISINYTEVYDPRYNRVEIPNKRVLDSTITNYILDDSLIDYSFQVDFPHRDDVDNDEIIEDVVKPSLSEFYEEYGDYLPREPEYGMSGMGFRERGYLIRVFFRKGYSKDLYDYQPILLEKLVYRWDQLVKEKSG
jgi:small-conductance mechanosensitive channel